LGKLALLVGQPVVDSAQPLASPSVKSTIKNITNSFPIGDDIVIEVLPFGVMNFEISEQGDILILSANKLARNLFGITETEHLPTPLEAIWASEERLVLANRIQDTYLKNTTTTFDWSKRSGHSETFLLSHIQPLFSKSSPSRQVLCTFEDQTAEKLSEQNIMHHAFHDALTGQPNRVMFRNKLEEAVMTSERNSDDVGCAVIVINIDRFQQINESFGHTAGDRFLISMSSTLRRCINSADILARLSGDEFAILMTNIKHLDKVEAVTNRIHGAMQQPYDLDGNEVFTSVSIGVATTISSSTHPEDLIRDADFAMHRAKLKGKARTEIYRRDSHQRARSQFHLETELRRAVERNELELYYQPIVDLDSAELRGFEALTRWKHKEKGMVSPVEFIGLAEETGIIVPLGRWAINTTCKRIRSWIDSFGLEKAVPINVNVSGVQFARDDVAAIVEQALKTYDLPGHLLRIELTESSIMANPNRISESLTRIRDLGVKVALDDFGTGYSSLNYLHQFPIDIIKIDRSFINQLQQGNTQYMILEMIGMLARNLGHEVVAEGLEDTNHIDMVKAMGFNFAQGYFYSRPVNTEIAATFVKGELPW
jgi:diguanylate cyclase (GGDEF)-like protein